MQIYMAFMIIVFIFKNFESQKYVSDVVIYNH